MAKARGTKYNGRPCKNCGGTLRYESGNDCVACRRRKNTSPEFKAYLKAYNYGISAEEYERMKQEHAGICPVCSTKVTTLVVDHCHVTGVVRGLICQPCNKALGFAKDNPAILRRLADYLEKTSERAAA